MTNLLAGFLFGQAVGILMLAPGWDAVVPAFGINLSVMAALWLGVAIGAETRARADIAVALLTFVVAAAALRTTPWLMVAGFLLQAWWSLQHRDGGFGVRGPAWFVIFAAAANGSFAVSLFNLLLFHP